MSAERIAELQRKLAAREGQPGYVDVCKKIREEIARLEALL